MSDLTPATEQRLLDIVLGDPVCLSYEAEDRVIEKAAALFADVDTGVEVRNEARVHLWYEEHFGVPADPFTSSADAIDHFASTTCCFGITREPGSGLRVYAPHGFDGLFGMVLRPNPVLAPREVYEAKARQWQAEWPRLVVEPWPER
ncbi:nucleotidyltransferase family protein [Rhodococcus pyridinivorans]|uniref:nucleotidyltransferase family protein n=1 Tax=Rhodococcus pyridinivorans TaxID=103816 RepID=UPI0021001378|nr:MULTISPECIES: nucleotidyltransferase family protein [Rhodococcus]